MEGFEGKIKVEIQNTILLSGESPPLRGRLWQAKAAINDMFNELDKFEREKSIELEGIRVLTTYETEDYEEPGLVKYRIQAEYTKRGEL